MVMDRSLAAARDPYDVCGKGRHKYAYNVRARQLLYKCLFWNPQLVVLRSSTTKIFIMVLAHLCASTRCYSQRSVARSLIRTIGENKSSGPTFEMRGGPSDSYYVTLVGRTL